MHSYKDNYDHWASKSIKRQTTFSLTLMAMVVK